jgi:uncharacterized membrane protein
VKLLATVSALLLLGYPFAVYFGLENLGIEGIAVALIGLFVIRIVLGTKAKLKELKYLTWMTGGVGITLLSLGTLLDHQGLLTFYPVVVNLCLLSVFAISLTQKQSLIERLAKLQDPFLNAKAIRYTRNVTKIWCLFFIVNGTISLSTCFMPIEIWALYNGLVSYLAIGLLFSIEFIVRKRIQGQATSSSTGHHE